MTYQETLSYLDSFVNYEKIHSYNYKESFKLDRIRHFLDLLGNPQNSLRAIHIAGTKGKGSTAAMVSSILTEAGLRVGLYTSPHLISFQERIKINMKDITESELSGLLEEMKPIIESMEKKDPLTFFEIYTAAAFLYFKKMKTDFVVLEVGLGGRLDATNAVNTSISAITPISFEHIKQLGTTLTEIAYEKAGIIKENSICFSSLQQEEALEAIENVCRRKNTKLYYVGRDIIVEENSFNSNDQSFKVCGRFGEYRDLKLNLLGRHQIMNAALAIGIIEALRLYGIVINQSVIQKALGKLNWPGRLEVVAKEPKIVLDGAQNVASTEVLLEAIKRHFVFKKLILILAISSDKDIKGIIETLSDFADEIILTKVYNPRAAEPVTIKKFFKNTKNLTLTNDTKEALCAAYAKAAQDDLILGTGSLFLVGELKEHLQKNA